MTKKQKQQEIATAMRYTGDKEQAEKKGERAEIYVISESLPEDSEVKKIIMRNIWEDNIGGEHDLGYKICAKACELIADLDLKDLEESEDIFYENASASIWNNERLSYLNINNEDEIFNRLFELSLDNINTACAIWFDDMVRSVALEFRDYILAD